jgi:hypothetical protein
MVLRNDGAINDASTDETKVTKNMIFSFGDDVVIGWATNTSVSGNIFIP